MTIASRAENKKGLTNTSQPGLGIRLGKYDLEQLVLLRIFAMSDQLVGRSARSVPDASVRSVPRFSSQCPVLCRPSFQAFVELSRLSRQTEIP